MKQYQYKDHDDYVKNQIQSSQSRESNVFVQAETLDVIAQKLQEKLSALNNGICHGTCNGYEQKYFRDKLKADVIGTDISPTAAQYPHTIQWDFHEVKDEWLDSFDFIYSNAFDHSYDPAMCIDRWMSCLRRGGYCILHWTIWHHKISQGQPLGATLGEYIDFAMPIVPVGGDPNRLNLVSDRYVEEVCRVTHSRVRQYGPDYLIWVKRV